MNKRPNILESLISGFIFILVIGIIIVFFAFITYQNRIISSAVKVSQGFLGQLIIDGFLIIEFVIKLLPLMLFGAYLPL